MIALCHDHGMDAVAAGGLLAIMGLFDLVGTTASGWLTDRVDPRKLLFAYYGLRGLSLIYLPFANFTFYGLSLFAVFYGLDWIATVPPTLAIANRAFGTKKAPGAVRLDLRPATRSGAASAAFFAGASRTATGSYLESFVIAGFVAVAAALLALMIGRQGPPATAVQRQPEPGKNLPERGPNSCSPNTVQAIEITMDIISSSGAARNWQEHAARQTGRSRVHAPRTSIISVLPPSSWAPPLAAAPARFAFSRVKDLVEVQGIRDNMLVGYGLVVGLNGTGD